MNRKPFTFHLDADVNGWSAAGAPNREVFADLLAAIGTARAMGSSTMISETLNNGVSLGKWRLERLEGTDTVLATPLGDKPAPCYVCGYGPHAPGAHVYTTEAETEAWFARQPQAEDYANGASLRAEAGLPL